MGRAEDLLNGLQDTNTNNEISLLIAGKNTDTEPHFAINDNRIISVPSELRTIAVQYDHNIETVTFDCPRYWDGHDMSKMIVYINYERADGETGAYLAENVRVDDEDDSIMHFEWTISRNVTSASGSVTFLVCIKSVNKSGNEQEHWNSERCSDISVAPGLETGEPIEEEYPDILTQLTKKIEDVSKSNVTINDEESSTTSTYSSNKINSLVDGKADSTTVTELSSKVGTLETTVGTKANQSELDTLEETVSTLQTTVSSKADQSDLDALETTVNNKADKSTVNAKQNKPTVKTITINASNWSSGVYTLSDSLITATSIQEWCLPAYTGSNTAEINALQAANIVDAGQSAGQAKIRCLGTVPTVTVHMVVIFWGN